MTQAPGHCLKPLNPPTSLPEPAFPSSHASVQHLRGSVHNVTLQALQYKQVKQVTQSSPLWEHCALKESSHQSQESLVEGQLPTPLCHSSSALWKPSWRVTLTTKLLTGQVKYTKPRWINVTNSHLLLPRKPASDQGECLQKGHLSQQLLGGSQEGDYCTGCGTSWGWMEGSLRRERKARKQQTSSHWLFKRKLLFTIFPSTGAHQQLKETSLNKNHITGPWGPSCAQESSRQCTDSDTRHVAQGDRSRVVGAWTSEVWNAGKYICLAEQQSQDWDWGSELRDSKRTGVFYGWVEITTLLYFKSLFFPFDDEMQLQA